MSTASPVPALVLDQTAMVSSTRGRGRGSRGHGCGRDVRKCDHCGRNNHTLDKCWDKFGRPPLAHLVSSESLAPDSTPSTVIIS